MFRVKISLKHLLLAIVWLSIALTLVSSRYAGCRADQLTLEKTTLKTNFAHRLEVADECLSHTKETGHNKVVNAHERN